MRITSPLLADRAQSETVGVVLLTGVVVITVAVIGGVVLSGVSPDSESPVVDIQGDATNQDVLVTHNGGDSLERSDVDIITADKDQRVRHSLDTYTQQVGTDSTRFERGDIWKRSNEVDGDEVTLIAIHVPSNTILDRETVDVRVTSFARFSYSPRNPTQSSDVDFDASDSEFTDGSIDTYEWDFDDDGEAEKTKTSETASYNFPDDGDYPVTLTITADDGRTSNRTKTVTVSNELPTASFTYNRTNPDPGDTIEFDASGSSDPDGTIQSYDWDWDNDGTYEASGETATHSYSTEGDKTVTLKVTDDDSSSSRESQTVTVGSSGQILQLTDTPNINDGDRLEFRAENTGDTQITIETFSIDIESNVYIENKNDDELFIDRPRQNGFANRNGNPKRFRANGTTYDLEADSNNGGQYAIIDANTDDYVLVQFRYFEQDVDSNGNGNAQPEDYDTGNLESTDSAADADIVVTFGLSDGSIQELYFKEV